MEICLDSNEYIFAFGIQTLNDSETLLTLLRARSDKWQLRIPRMVVKEVSRNLTPGRVKLCHEFWLKMGCAIDEEDAIPIGLIETYRGRGLKPGDATIAAYCEHAAVDFLISENRDFLTLTKSLLFRIVKAAEFLKLVT